MQSLFKGKLKDLILLTAFTGLITFLIWLPYFLRVNNLEGLDFSQGFATIYRNFDGLEYVTIAKSLYNPQIIAQLPNSLSPNYYAAHFPGYSLLILLFATVLGFLKSMLFVSLLFTLLSVFAFYYLLKEFKLTTQPLFLSFLFLILPARWLIVHSVGSAEPVFIFFVISALCTFLKYEAEKKARWVWLTAFFGLAAQFTRPPGILLFGALGLYILWEIIRGRKNFFRSIVDYYPLLLIPLTLLGIFYWYSVSYHDFFAYFHSGDNIHLMFPPYQVFNKHQYWVGDIWLEDIVYTFLLGFLGGILLLKQKLTFPLGFFVLTYLTASTFVAHRDISRYVLPVFPFVLIAFQKALTSKEFKIALVLIIWGIYLYAQNFILANTAPIPNLGLFN